MASIQYNNFSRKAWWTKTFFILCKRNIFVVILTWNNFFSKTAIRISIFPSGKIKFCQGKVREKSGNFKVCLVWQPWILGPGKCDQSVYWKLLFYYIKERNENTFIGIGPFEPCRNGKIITIGCSTLDFSHHWAKVLATGQSFSQLYPERRGPSTVCSNWSL